MGWGEGIVRELKGFFFYLRFERRIVDMFRRRGKVMDSVKKFFVRLLCVRY